MLAVLRGSWALFFGIMFAAAGGGFVSTLIGVRGVIEGFSPFGISITHSGYYLGYILGVILVPKLIAQAGHVRVFTAFASMASLCLLLYPIFPNLFVWIILRTFSGFCYSGCLFVMVRRVNTIATTKTSSHIVFIYLIVQLAGGVLTQVILNLASVEGYELYVIGSVIMSLSLVPMMLSIGIRPEKRKHPIKFIDTTPMGAVAAFLPGKIVKPANPMGLHALLVASPLSAIGMVLLGGLFAIMSTMWATFGMEKGLSIAGISIFISAIYIGGVITQYPMGWLSDRMDKRWLIVAITAVGAIVSFYSIQINNDIILLGGVGLVFGGVLNPLYSLYMTYTKDILGEAGLANATGMLFYCNVTGAITGSLVIGAAMTLYGAEAYFIYIAVLMGFSAIFTLYHIIRGAGVPVKKP